MKKTCLTLFALTLLAGCKSVNLPPIAESEMKINQYSIELRRTENDLREIAAHEPGQRDLDAKINKNSINRIFNLLAGQRTDDVKIQILPKQNFMVEEKNYLGVKFTNYLNINKGNVDVNLKSLQIDKIEKNKLYARIELEGKGKINVSGKYMGVASSVEPEIYLYLNEQAVFDISSSSEGAIRINPQKKTLMLKSKIGINFLKWQIPWNQNIPLELTELLSPIDIPATFSTDFALPMPSATGVNKFDQKMFTLRLKSPKATADGNYIEFKTDVEFKQK